MNTKEIEERIEKLKKDKESMWDIVKRHRCADYKRKVIRAYDMRIAELQALLKESS